ncbi:MAG: nucleotidyltransferase [Rikenellaceae bacterium]|nr:nucleotidyltransferase [Rikenellaceae bacterium]
MKPTLLVLAAGMGSRYGSLKQMDGIGPNNEAIIDYSIYDAIRVGFGRVVFVIRHSFEKEFREVFSEDRFKGRIQVDFVYQELDSLPQGYTVPAGREKPWGTNHAVMMGTSAIRQEPFAVINADDFYGAEAYRGMAEYLRELAGGQNKYCMMGYKIGNTLSRHGSVSRGVCSMDEQGNLVDMVERTQIFQDADRIFYRDEQGDHTLPADSLVSMNMFGFTPDYFRYSEAYFPTFLTENQDNLKAEFFIPLMVNRLITAGQASMKVLSSEAKWFGVTYKKDKPAVVAQLNELIAAGKYPSNLWE